MYEELIDDLRTLARVCELTYHEHTSTHRLAVQAADAIEKMSKLADAIPHVCECCIGCELEKKNGGCDNAFVLSPKRAMQYLIKPRWISVEERLPEKFQPVWAAVKMDGREDWVFDTVYDPYLKCPWGNYYYLEKGDAIVYAWMDRSEPEPPKEET